MWANWWTCSGSAVVTPPIRGVLWAAWTPHWKESLQRIWTSKEMGIFRSFQSNLYPRMLFSKCLQNLCQALWPQTTSFLGQKASIHCSWLLVPLFGWLRSKQWYTHALDLQAFRASADQVNLGYWRIFIRWKRGNVPRWIWRQCTHAALE